MRIQNKTGYIHMRFLNTVSRSHKHHPNINAKISTKPAFKRHPMSLVITL